MGPLLNAVNIWLVEGRPSGARISSEVRCCCSVVRVRLNLWLMIWLRCNFWGLNATMEIVFVLSTLKTWTHSYTLWPCLRNMRAHSIGFAWLQIMSACHIINKYSWQDSVLNFALSRAEAMLKDAYACSHWKHPRKLSFSDAVPLPTTAVCRRWSS